MARWTQLSILDLLEEEEMEQQAYPDITPKGRDDKILPSMEVNRKKKKKLGVQLGPAESILEGNPGGGPASTSW